MPSSFIINNTNIITMRTKVNEISISYTQKIKNNNRQRLNSSVEVANYLRSLWNPDTISIYESFVVLMLNNSNRVNGFYTLSTGGINATFVDIRILFAIVLKSLSTGIILAHNHPSGNLNPSESDKNLTQKAIKAGKLFDIKTLDHIILTPENNYFSFADEGLI
jgi:DNA repair protein RadC